MAVDFGGGLAGAASGAMTGSMFGAPGAVVGGVLGGAAGLFGGKKKPKKVSTLDKTQKGIYGNYAQAIGGQGPYADMFNFDEQGAGNVFDRMVADPELRNFRENIIPEITGQFRNNNLQNSSYAGESLSRAGRDVSERLGGLRSQQLYNERNRMQQNKQNAIDRILGMQTFAYDTGGQGGGGFDSFVGGMGNAAGSYMMDRFSRPGGGGGGAGFQGGGQSFGSGGINPALF